MLTDFQICLSVLLKDFILDCLLSYIQKLFTAEKLNATFFSDSAADHIGVFHLLGKRVKNTKQSINCFRPSGNT